MNETRQFHVKKSSNPSVSVWTEGDPVFEVNGNGKNASLWVGIDGDDEHAGVAWFWMGAAAARRLRRFLDTEFPEAGGLDD